MENAGTSVKLCESLLESSTINLSWSNCLFPGIFSVFLSLCWKTQQNSWKWHIMMWHPGVGVPVQPWSKHGQCICASVVNSNSTNAAETD